MQLSPTLLFENEDFLAVDKPAGWLSIPAREPKPDDRVISHWVNEYLAPAQAHLIHRLDRFTSGVMLLAKNEFAQKTGNAWFEKRVAKKTYLFLASPLPSRPAIQIRTPVDGKPAQSLFELMDRAPTAFLGKATPLTGRFHQIREHAQVAGFPLLGDKAYGGLMNFMLSSGTSLEIPRVCLHASRLELPVGIIEAPLAEDLSLLWEKIKND